MDTKSLGFGSLTLPLILEIRLDPLRIVIYFTVSRSLVFVRGRGVKGSPLPDKLTNEQCSELLYYWIKHQDLDSLDRKRSSDIRKFLENPSKYARMQANLETGFSRPGDVWQELATYLNLTEEEKGMGRMPELLLEEEMHQDMDKPAFEEREEELGQEKQEPMGEEYCVEEGREEVAALARREEDCKLGRQEEELPHLVAAGLPTRDLAEVARRIRHDSFQLSILSYGLVNVLQSPQVRHCETYIYTDKIHLGGRVSYGDRY